MNNDDARGMSNNYPRKPSMPQRYEKQSYGHSSNYNYNQGNAYNQNQNGYSNQNNYNGGGQHPRRRVDRFRRETMNQSDRIVKQNDIIIRLLKEIRDRLPPPPAGAAIEQDGACETERAESGQDTGDEGQAQMPGQHQTDTEHEDGEGQTEVFASENAPPQAQ